MAGKMRKGATIEEMEEEIGKKDPAVRKVKDYIRTHPTMSRGIISQNIEGFIGYFKHLGARDV